MATNAASETAIFERIVLPSDPGLSEVVANAVLRLAFSPEDASRMQVLAEKSKQGVLAPDEELEIENYERVGHYISILQSKARMSLRESTDAGS